MLTPDHPPGVHQIIRGDLLHVSADPEVEHQADADERRPGRSSAPVPGPTPAIRRANQANSAGRDRLDQHPPEQLEPPGLHQGPDVVQAEHPSGEVEAHALDDLEAGPEQSGHPSSESGRVQQAQQDRPGDQGDVEPGQGVVRDQVQALLRGWRPPQCRPPRASHARRPSPSRRRPRHPRPEAPANDRPRSPPPPGAKGAVAAAVAVPIAAVSGTAPSMAAPAASSAFSGSNPYPNCLVTIAKRWSTKKRTTNAPPKGRTRDFRAEPTGGGAEAQRTEPLEPTEVDLSPAVDAV